MGRLIGYARVSTREQDLALQIDALVAAGCVRIFEDKVSGAKSVRNGLEDCLSSLQDGDTLIIWRLDRLGRSLQHLVKVVTDLKDKGISLRSIQDGVIDTTTANGGLIFNIFAAIAEFERELISERTHAGLAAARIRGKKGGRRPVSKDDTKVKLARLMRTDPNHSVKEICSTLDISRATFYRYIQQ
jgi:DNA invertase Pin-like site-specific DNA recombinase